MRDIRVTCGNQSTMNDQPLRADDAIIVFADLQEGIINVGSTTDVERLRTCVAALAEVAVIFKIPVVVTCVPTTSGSVSPALTEITARFPQTAPHVRTTANAMEDSAFRATLEGLNRRSLIICGVATEVAVALAAVAANRLGYAVAVAVDACSGLDARSESATLMRLSALGIALTSVPAIAAELGGDFSSESGRNAMRALQSIVGVHGHAHHEHQHNHTGGDSP